MIPQSGQLVTVVFRNGVSFQGTVISWSDGKSSLKFGGKIKVIHKTLDDILYYEIIETKIDYEQIKAKPVKNSDDIENLVELKKELLQLEREGIADKLRNHTPTSSPQLTQYQNIVYELPGQLRTIQNPLQYPREETPREDIEFGAGLQDLFGKTHN